MTKETRHAAALCAVAALCLGAISVAQSQPEDELPTGYDIRVQDSNPSLVFTDEWLIAAVRRQAVIHLHTAMLPRFSIYETPTIGDEYLVKTAGEFVQSEAFIADLRDYISHIENHGRFGNGNPDLNNDGVVDGADYGILLAAWGPVEEDE